MGTDRADLRRALFSLAVHSRTDHGLARAQLSQSYGAEAQPLDAAFKALSRSKGRIPRVVVFAALQRLVQRRGIGVLAMADYGPAYAHLIHELDLPDPRQPFPGAPVIHRGMIGTLPIPLGGASWSWPVCTDTAVFGPSGQNAIEITLTFSTTRTVTQMAPYADPTTWPNCSAFFVAMDVLSVARSTSDPTGDWTAVVEEVVEVVPGCPMTTPLMFEYQTTGTTKVESTYSLLEPTSYLDVDEGGIIIEEDTSGSGYASIITATKTIHWLDPWMQAWPEVACYTFWGELGLDMAAECSGGI